MAGDNEKGVAHGSLRPMVYNDLRAVFEMRNSIDVRRYMFTQRQIEFSEHTKWFETIKQNDSTLPYVFELEGILQGFVQFKKTTHSGVVEWGFFTARGTPKGTGKQLGVAALRQAYEKDGIWKVCGQCLATNDPSIGFHRSLGFKEEGIFRRHHLCDDVYQDIICFGLLKNEWSQSRFVSEVQN